MANNEQELLAAFAKILEQMGTSTGASGLMQLGGQQQQGMFGSQGAAQRGNPYGTSVPLDSGQWKSAVGGPGQPIGPHYGPQGVIFPGGSPFPVDPGPANLQNAMVGLRDLMNTPIGQSLIAKLKEKAGFKGQP